MKCSILLRHKSPAIKATPRGYLYAAQHVKGKSARCAIWFLSSYQLGVKKLTLAANRKKGRPLRITLCSFGGGGSSLAHSCRAIGSDIESVTSELKLSHKKAR